MKKILIAILAFCFAAPFVWAVPADPTPYKYVQPDGSVIVLQNHGDEFFHWTTDATGQVVKKMADGFYRPVEINMAAEAAKAEELRARMNAFYRYDTPPVTNFGDRKVLCLLANFTDISYTVANPKEHFSNMLNQVGYSEGGSIGSVRDYFMDNSGGQYRPQFDVYGPVPLANPSQYYDTEGVSLAIMEA
jgi:immune inhibitor A